jgi:hypothetical protein
MRADLQMGFRLLMRVACLLAQWEGLRAVHLVLVVEGPGRRSLGPSLYPYSPTFGLGAFPEARTPHSPGPTPISTLA